MGLALLAVVLLVLGLAGLGAFWFVMFRNTGDRETSEEDRR